MSDTLLVLTGIGVPRFAARGLTESLAPIDLGELRRDINGVLRDLTEPSLDRRYGLTISGGDVRPMALDGVWRGKELTVDCVTELGKAGTFAAGTATVALDRVPVPGSGFAQLGDVFTSDVVFSEASDNTWTATATFPGGVLAGAGFIYYRPRLVCMVTGWSGDLAEWAAAPTWSLELEEVGDFS